jgi:hypothetical protein
MSTKRFYRRRFLNRRGYHVGAYVIADCQVDVFRRRDPRAEHFVDADVTIADCSRIVTLDFDVSDETDARNALHKARLLRDVMVEFTAALEAAVDDWRELRH